MSQILKIAELVELITATGAMLSTFSQPARGISVRTLQWLHEARTPQSTP
jgi:hypothetical protein